MKDANQFFKLFIQVGVSSLALIPLLISFFNMFEPGQILRAGISSILVLVFILLSIGLSFWGLYSEGNVPHRKRNFVIASGLCLVAVYAIVFGFILMMMFS